MLAYKTIRVYTLWKYGRGSDSFFVHQHTQHSLEWNEHGTRFFDLDQGASKITVLIKHLQDGLQIA